MSAGSINSPQLLMLSGVGPAEHLQKFGINVLQNSRVGDNLQDHVGMTGLTFMIDKPVSIVQNRFQVGTSAICRIVDRGARGGSIYARISFFAKCESERAHVRDDKLNPRNKFVERR